MVQENKNQNKKKVDFKERSTTQKCKYCGRPLKINSVNKNHTCCYVCFNIEFKGRKTSVKRKSDGQGGFIIVKTINFIELQKQNIRKYGGGLYYESNN